MGLSTTHSPGEFCNRHFYNHYTISCFATPFLYEKRGEILQGAIGDVIVNSPGEVVYHGDICENGNGFVNDWIYVKGDNIEKIINKYPIPLNTAIHTGNKYFINGYLENIKSEKIFKKNGYQDMIDSAIMQLIIDLHRTTFNNMKTVAKRIEKARFAIIKNPQNDHSIDSLAKLCGYSVGRFAHLYKETYGITPLQSIIIERINMAKSLLEYGGLSVSDVASACGFQNIYYFSKCFKERTGMSPTNYKKADNPMHRNLN